MGIYQSVYKNKCPRCNDGDVYSTFISVGPMSYTEGCNKCGADDFNEDEVRGLGDKLGVTFDLATNTEQRFEYPVPNSDQNDTSYD